ncbi:MAG: translation initiation factor IF-2 subunit alpha [Candidatus Bathyarchaeota archaeon]|jgi:translation initiation factor 2 subunit 1|nr:translation initiation factor IF-2 subunit alpha [Candidatus Bathyarchaeota archaeon]
MEEGRLEWPEVGDLVVATVQRIAGHGAYVALDEYDGKEGLLHISEISSRWVRNIRNHVRERQKLVLQVLRVDPSREQVDLSLRRVTQDERRKKLEDWKKNRKAETILKGVAVGLNMSEAKLFEEAGAKLVEHHGSLYAGLEEAAKRGVEALRDAGVAARVAKALAEAAKEKIIVKGVMIQGVFEITSMEPNGVDEIRRTLLEAKTIAEELDTEANLYALGAPKYRIEVNAGDYRAAEAALDKIVESTTQAWAKHDGEISFSRG